MSKKSFWNYLGLPSVQDFNHLLEELHKQQLKVEQLEQATRYLYQCVSTFEKNLGTTVENKLISADENIQKQIKNAFDKTSENIMKQMETIHSIEGDQNELLRMLLVNSLSDNINQMIDSAQGKK